MLTQDYIQMNHDELYKTIQKHIAVVEKYPANIRSYLEKELGPVSAFVPEYYAYKIPRECLLGILYCM